MYTTVFKKFTDKKLNGSMINAVDGTQSRSALANAFFRISGVIDLIKEKLIQRSDNDFNAYARKALGHYKIVYEVITAQKLSEFIRTSESRF